MFKQKILNLFTLTALTLAVVLPSKKAEAGSIIGGPAFTTIAIVGGATTFGVFGFGAIAAIGGTDIYDDFDSPIFTILMISGLTLLILDAEDNQKFETIPPYLLQEIEDVVRMRAEFIAADENGLKEVVFSHEDVDALFELADSATSQDELEKLRDLLTTKTL